MTDTTTVTAGRGAPAQSTKGLDTLDLLEAEAIHIIREVAAEFERPVLLFSGGKDSICLLRLAEKAFKRRIAGNDFAGSLPFPLLHVDTTWKFKAMYEMRERMARESGMELIVHQNPEAKEKGIKQGDKVKVKLLGFDDRGKTRLSMKAVDQETGEDLEAKQKSDAPAPREAAGE